MSRYVVLVLHFFYVFFSLVMDLCDLRSETTESYVMSSCVVHMWRRSMVLDAEQTSGSAAESSHEAEGPATLALGLRKWWPRPDGGRGDVPLLPRS